MKWRRRDRRRGWPCSAPRRRSGCRGAGRHPRTDRAHDDRPEPSAARSPARCGKSRRRPAPATERRLHLADEIENGNALLAVADGERHRVAARPAVGGIDETRNSSAPAHARARPRPARCSSARASASIKVEALSRNCASYSQAARAGSAAIGALDLGGRQKRVHDPRRRVPNQHRTGLAEMALVNAPENAAAAEGAAAREQERTRDRRHGRQQGREDLGVAVGARLSVRPDPNFVEQGAQTTVFERTARWLRVQTEKMMPFVSAISSSPQTRSEAQAAACPSAAPG